MTMAGDLIVLPSILGQVGKTKSIQSRPETDPAGPIGKWDDVAKLSRREDYEA